jgi:uncharacterized protein YjiS (DUF1127 family)
MPSQHTQHAERRLAAAWRLVHLPGLWCRRLRERRELSLLSPEQMRDVGLDPEMAKRESIKPFWVA